MNPGTPLTDLRSVSASLVFHVAAVLVLWALAARLSATAESLEPLAVEITMSPVDNRAMPTSDDQGGGPGELGGVGPLVSVRLDEERQGSSDPVLEAYLAMNPDSASQGEEDTVETLPMDARGVGVVPGPGLGGGGGRGGGSGGGIGKGIGPGTEFFGLKVPGGSFVFLIDHSGSMSNFGKLEVAKSELMRSLEGLPAGVKVGVIFYNTTQQKLRGEESGYGLMSASERNRASIREQVESIRATGGTDHAGALRAGFSSGAEVVFFLTDGQLLTPTESERLQQEAGKVRVQVVEFGMGPDPGTWNASKELAKGTGGQYRYVDVRSFER